MSEQKFSLNSEVVKCECLNDESEPRYTWSRVRGQRQTLCEEVDRLDRKIISLLSSFTRRDFKGLIRSGVGARTGKWVSKGWVAKRQSDPFAARQTLGRAGVNCNFHPILQVWKERECKRLNE